MEDEMRFDQVINATPWELRVFDESEERSVVLETGPFVAGVAAERSVRLSDASVDSVRIPVVGCAGQVVGLPDPRPGVFYMVTLAVAVAAGTSRQDLLVYGPKVDDDDGKAIGYHGLRVWHSPVAMREPLSPSTKEDIGKLVDYYDEDHVRTASPKSLFDDLFKSGLISVEEKDRAQANFGAGWTDAGPRVFATKTELAALKEWGPDEVPWTWYTPFGLASILLGLDLISQKEYDLAADQFADAWKGDRR
jgi:hypothetical protein